MENKKVFIGNLDFAVTEEEIKTLLSDYGTVVNIKMHRKKGYAFIEMSDEAEAALAIEKLNGTMFKDRGIRASLEINASKAKAFSIHKYNERAEGFSRRKKSERPGSVLPDETETDSVKTESDEISEYDDNNSNTKAPRPVNKRPSAQRSTGSPRPRGKEWSHDRPANSNRPSRDNRKPGYGRSSQPDSNYNTGERFSGPGDRPARNYPRGRSDASYPQRKEWSHDKPAYSKGPSRDGQKSNHGRSSKPVSNYDSSERFSNSDNRPLKKYPRGRSESSHPQRKEWSHDKPSFSNRHPRDDHKSGHGKSSEPEINYNTRERFPDPDARPSGNYSRERSGSPHPRRKEWSHDKPAHSNRHPREGHKSGHGRSSEPETNYNSRERFSGPDGRSPGNYSRGRSDSPHPQRKEWSHDKPAYPRRPSTPSKQSGDRTRNDSKPRPKARGGEGNKGRNNRPKRD